MSGPRVALATCAHHPGMMAGDDEALEARLVPMGFDVVRPRWDDPDVAWDRFDAVVIRTTWDYQDHLDEFLAWVDRVGAATRLFNGPETVRTNLNKRYLRDLDRAGVPIVPSVWLDEPGGAAGVRTAIDTLGVDHAALKPVVGAGASGLLIFARPEIDAAGAHADEQIRTHTGAFVQPVINSIQTRGELSVVLIDGEVTHAVRKVPAPGDWRVQIEFGGSYTLEDPGEIERDISARAISALCSDAEGVPMYARIDLVEVDGIGPAVIEAELVEPELFFPQAPEAADSLGRALLARIS